MPEIGEVARIVSYIQKHLVGKTLAVVKAQHDENVFGKVGTSAAEIEKKLTGKKVLDAQQQGKYFWLVMSTPPHLLCHFGMAGWFKIRDVETAYYKPTKAEPVSEWPPKYWRFRVETKEHPKTEAAFVDFRRFARVRLVDCSAEDMRNTTPLKENGPDPVIDKDIVNEQWLTEICQSKKVPIKALLLNQANISGIGNWVGDEIMYDARMHPEQYCNTLSASQLKQLHKSIHYVCGLAVEVQSDSSRFPEEWLFKHRWGRGKKDSLNMLPNGSKIVFLTVGGRTSAIVPSVQKKTGPVAGDFEGEAEEEEGKEEEEEGDEEEEDGTIKKKPKSKSKSTPQKKTKKPPKPPQPKKKEEEEEEEEANSEPEPTKQHKPPKTAAKPTRSPRNAKSKVTYEEKDEEKDEDDEEEEEEEEDEKHTNNNNNKKAKPTSKSTSNSNSKSTPKSAPKSKKRKAADVEPEPDANGAVNGDMKKKAKQGGEAGGGEGGE
ncbi:hypothetical protein MMC09_001249 [Bachmanniomyces sp. S44760]|nr:hypothetical protein [Bachmanniomyces sp. S44760]